MIFYVNVNSHFDISNAFKNTFTLDYYFSPGKTFIIENYDPLVLIFAKRKFGISGCFEFLKI